MQDAQVIQGIELRYASLASRRDERLRRQWAATVARSLGGGGVMAVRRATGVFRKTIARGLEEWDDGVASVTRLRSPGGGRKAATETDPESARALERLEVLGPDEIAIVHVMNRVVRRCFLLGDDPVTGKNYDHPKESPIHRTFHGKELAETQKELCPLWACSLPPASAIQIFTHGA